MVFGHNSNILVGANTVHVQTENRGGAHPVIDTTVHWKGRVLHRRTSNYQDLLPLDGGKESALKSRVDDQHRAVIAEIRSGVLQLTIPAPVPTQPEPAAKSLASANAGSLKVNLSNARTWLSGRNATLQVLVHDAAGDPVPNASATARVEGAASPFEFAGQTSAAGIATLQFEMPKLGSGEAALVIEVAHNGDKGQLRFQLRSKPKS